jgi:hypothetical protein
MFQQLYDSEINFEVSCFWDAGFDVRLGDAVNGLLAQDKVPTVTDGRPITPMRATALCWSVTPKVTSFTGRASTPASLPLTICE